LEVFLLPDRLSTVRLFRTHQESNGGECVLVRCWVSVYVYHEFGRTMRN
jgi:hypothetical protein